MTIYLRQLSKLYGLTDPLDCLKMDPPDKAEYKELVLTKISAFHEKKLRIMADSNSSMKFLNVATFGLRGRHHPVISGLKTTLEVQKSRPHIKMLCMDYLTFEKKAKQQGGSSSCKCCTDNEVENLTHILTSCTAYSNIRERIFPQFSKICSLSNFDFWAIVSQNSELAQFILDPTSLNLNQRLNISDKNVDSLMKLTHDYCYAVHKQRISILDQLKSNH